LIISHVELQVAEDQRVFKREFKEEVYHTQQSFFCFVNTVYWKERWQSLLLHELSKTECSDQKKLLFNTLDKRSTSSNLRQ